MATAGTAVFDFDRTLIAQESMAMFLRLVAGEHYIPACCAAAAKAAVTHSSQRRAVFRAEVLRRTLGGKTLAQAQAAAERLYPRLRWIPWTMDDLARHRDAGRRIVIATGSLSAYMPRLLALKDLSYDVLLSTEMVVEGDTLTGAMATPSCTWDSKAQRVGALLQSHPGPVWGYGNLPPDGPMLALTDHPTVVPLRGGHRRPTRQPPITRRAPRHQ